MTDYGKMKCELLEKKGFDASNMAWWIESETETARTYCFVRKEEGASVGRVTISLKDDIAEMNTAYGKLLAVLKDFKDFLIEDCGKNEIKYCDAETTNVMSYVASLANDIDCTNMDVHDIEEELPWSEVADIFECDLDEDEWHLKN